MPSAVSGRQWPARVAGEEHAVLGRPGAAGAGSSCPGSRPAAAPTSSTSRSVGCLTWIVRVERADADPQLVARGERPAVAGVDVARVDPQLEVGAGAARDGPPGRARAAPRAAGRSSPGAEHPPPAERVDDQRRASRRRGRCARRRPVRPSTFAVSNSASPHCSHSSSHSCAVVERGERPRQRPAGAARRRRVDDAASRTSAGSTPPARGCAATRWAPRTPRSAARRSRSGRARARARRVARSSRATASPANEAPQIRTSASAPEGNGVALGAALRGSYRHGQARYSIWPLMEATLTPP